MAKMVRYVQDNDKAGPDSYYFKKVETPQPGDTICHGEFRPYTHDLDVGCETRYTPVGEYTTEKYSGGTETF
jgi:hypothetical protein